MVGGEYIGDDPDDDSDDDNGGTTDTMGLCGVALLTVISLGQSLLL